MDKTMHLGGPGIKKNQNVETDEMKFGKRKYNQERNERTFYFNYYLIMNRNTEQAHCALSDKKIQCGENWWFIVLHRQPLTKKWHCQGLFFFVCFFLATNWQMALPPTISPWYPVLYWMV